MKFSIIMPVYNREKCVLESIMSVVKQGYADWELIVVDDGSKDNTLNVCNSIARHEPRVEVYSQPNKGVSAARNTGLKAAAGEYIMFLDSDDFLAPNALETMDILTHENECADILCFGFAGIGGGQWRSEKDISDKLYNREWIWDYILPEHINVHPKTKWSLQPFIWNKCFRRGLLLEHSIFFDEERRTWEDNKFLVACLAQAKNLYLSDRILYKLGDSGANDHLSQVYNPGLLFGYLKSYEEYSLQFGDRYNFDNPYTNTRYFTITCDILRRLQMSMDEAPYDGILDAVMVNRYFCYWSKKTKIKTIKTIFIKLAVRFKCKVLIKCVLPERESLKHRIKLFLSKIKRRLLKRK